MTAPPAARPARTDPADAPEREPADLPALRLSDRRQRRLPVVRPAGRPGVGPPRGGRPAGRGAGCPPRPAAPPADQGPLVRESDRPGRTRRPQRGGVARPVQVPVALSGGVAGLLAGAALCLRGPPPLLGRAHCPGAASPRPRIRPLAAGPPLRRPARPAHAPGRRRRRDSGGRPPSGRRRRDRGVRGALPPPAAGRRPGGGLHPRRGGPRRLLGLPQGANRRPPAPGGVPLREVGGLAAAAGAERAGRGRAGRGGLATR
jgi:hypothetical protein